MSDRERLLEDALRSIRKAAGGAQQLTNRLQYIYERAGVALAGLQWDREWKAQYGYQIRERALVDNDALRESLRGLLRVAYVEMVHIEDGEPRAMHCKACDARWPLGAPDEHDRDCQLAVAIRLVA